MCLSVVDNSPVLRKILLILLLPIPVVAQTTQEKVREFRRANEHRILKEFTTLLSIPNVASDTENIHKNAALIIEMMQQRGLNPRLLEGASRSVPPAVYGEWKVPGAQRTILLYAHYDGQPTDPKQWTGTSPWQPVYRSAALHAGGQIITGPTDGSPIDPEWRIYARSASDDKASELVAIDEDGTMLRIDGRNPAVPGREYLPAWVDEQPTSAGLDALHLYVVFTSSSGDTSRIIRLTRSSN